MQVDTLIIGAGVIGSSVAMHLAQLDPKRSVRVIDFDLEGSLSSSELNAGGVRATFSQPLNIRMSQLSIDYFAQIAEEVGYRSCGYLWLHPAERVSFARQALERQRQAGWPVEDWDLAELRRRVPLIDKTEGIAAAFFAPRDGLVNPNRLKNHFREKARARGVVFEDRLWLQKAEFSKERVHLYCEKFPLALSHEAKVEVVSGNLSLGNPTVEYEAKEVINCAGPWAVSLAKTLGYSSPSFAVRRQVCIFDCRDADLTRYGMIIDPSGVYFHPEATNGLAGFADPTEQPGVNYSYDGESFFLEKIWPALYERSSAFERLKHLTGWAGLYDVSPDESAIIGEASVTDPQRAGKIFEAHSFSGHGVMHSYAAGLALAELMVQGRYVTVDASMLSGQRFQRGAELHEGAVI